MGLHQRQLALDALHLLATLGWLPDPEPAPALEPCGYCCGRGWEDVTGRSGAEYRFDCPICDGAGTVEVGEDDEPVIPLAPASCDRCQGAGQIAMSAPGANAVYTATTPCHGAGQGPARLAA